MRLAALLTSLAIAAMLSLGGMSDSAVAQHGRGGGYYRGHHGGHGGHHGRHYGGHHGHYGGHRGHYGYGGHRHYGGRGHYGGHHGHVGHHGHSGYYGNYSRHGYPGLGRYTSRYFSGYDYLPGASSYRYLPGPYGGGFGYLGYGGYGRGGYGVGSVPYYSYYSARQPSRTGTYRSYQVNPDAQQSDARQSTAESSLVDRSSPATAAGLDYLRQAEQAFRERDYGRAAQRVSHALVEMPEQGKVFLFASQAMFAVGDYQGAAAAIHQAASLLEPDDWGYVVENFRQWYRNRDYVDQMDRLKAFIRENPDEAHALFVRGYHFGSLGHEEEAVADLTRAYELEPRDELAVRLIERFGGQPPADAKARPEESEAPGDDSSLDQPEPVETPGAPQAP